MVAQASGEVLAAGLESLGDLLGDKLDGLLSRRINLR